jgi:hypothetical protein
MGQPLILMARGGGGAAWEPWRRTLPHQKDFLMLVYQ